MAKGLLEQVIIPTEKKQGANECLDFRTISLIPNASKVVLRFWSVALYAAETWKLTKADRQRLEAFKIWIWRRMMEISWEDKISNEEVLAQINETRTMLNSIQARNIVGQDMLCGMTNYFVMLGNANQQIAQ